MLSTPKAKSGLFLASSLCDGLEDNDIRQVTTLLLNNEADPNILIPTHGVTPFHLVIGNDSEAFAEEVTKLFLRHGGDPNVRSAEGLTPVHVAAAWGRVSVLELLLANGGDPLRLDDEGRSPFHYAFDGKYYNAVAVLGKYCEGETEAEEPTKYTMTLDKLVVSDGSYLAEYSTHPSLDSSSSSAFHSASTSPADSAYPPNRPANPPTSLRPKTKSQDREDPGHPSSAELRIRRMFAEEQSLVLRIIDQLSSSLTAPRNPQELPRLDSDSPPNPKKPDDPYDSALETSAGLLWSSPDSFGTPKLKFSLKDRRHAVTSRYRRRVFSPLGRSASRRPRAEETVLSGSPNCALACGSERRDTRLERKILELREVVGGFFVDSMGKERARSTPRRRQRPRTASRSSRRRRNRNPRPRREQNTSAESLTSLSFQREADRSCAQRLFFNEPDSRHEAEFLASGGATGERRGRKVDGGDAPWKEDLDVDSLGLANLALDEEPARRAGKACERKTEPTWHDTGVVDRSEASGTFLSSWSQSFVSVQEDYKYEDSEHRVNFLERRRYNVPSSTSTKSTNQRNQRLTPPRTPKAFQASHAPPRTPSSLFHSALRPSTPSNLPPHLLRPSTPSNLPPHLLRLTDSDIRAILISLGDAPGPVNRFTRQVYLRRLVQLQKTQLSPQNSFAPSASPKLPSRASDGSKSPSRCPKSPVAVNIPPSLAYGDWTRSLDTYRLLERRVFAEFSAPSHDRRWREGTAKQSFNYLLLDPRSSENLPLRATEMTDEEVWASFLRSVFYVGKGKESRPYQHLYDAFDFWVGRRSDSYGRKVSRIMDVWNEGYGVVCLHVFHSTIPVEAYTREAAMIDALGLDALTNDKSGNYYGIMATWSLKEKKKFGRYLLHSALQILLHEGERQLLPQHLRGV